MKKLNLGCGKDILQNFINADKVKLPGVDIVMDFDVFPYKFKANEFEYVIAKSVLEHSSDLIKIMEELHRICKNKAIIEIIVPHFESLGAFKDPTHKIFFSYYTFDYFTEDFDYNFYTKARFKILERKIIYNFKPLQVIANKFPKFHEIFLRKFLPVKNLSFKLEVVK